MANETVLILADGDASAVDSLRKLAASADVILAADGGYVKALQHGIQVDEVIGDLDSIPEEEKKALLESEAPAVHAFPEEKDWTDLELAIDHALTLRPASIHLFGVLGSRLDHSITAVHLLEKGLNSAVSIVLHTKEESARLIENPTELEWAAAGDRVSLIPMTETVCVTTEGLRFPLRRERLERAASRGVSNVVERLPVRIDVSEGRLLVVHAAKQGDGNG